MESPKTRRFTTLFAILVAASLATAGRYQARVLLVRVIESGSQQPLPNAEVIDLESGARRFPNTAGEARVAWPASARLRLRVRQLGYQFVDGDIARVAPGDVLIDTITVTLGRVAYVLPDVTTRVTGCSTDADSSQRLEGYTTFRSPSPFIVIPDSTVALWWRREAVTYKPPWTGPDVVQLLELLGVTYRKETPPAGDSSERR